MKIVLFEPAGRIHSSQYSLINNPPEGYTFTTPRSSCIDRLTNNTFIFDKLRLQLLDRLIPLNYTKAQIDNLINRKENSDLTYAYNHIVPDKGKRWVCQVEWSHILVGRDPKWISLYKNKVKYSLQSCSKILAWTQAAKESIIDLYGNDLEERIVVIPHAEPTKITHTDYTKPNILFVTSTNSPNEFEIKGGREVLQAFKLIHIFYPSLHLIIRSRIPKRYKYEINPESTTIIEDSLPLPEFQKLFTNSLVFLFPSYLPHNTVPIEAMSYGLPIITTHEGSSFGEYIENNKTGLVLPKVTKYLTNKGLLKSETIHRLQLVKDNEPYIYKTSRELASMLEYLVESGARKARLLGSKARQEVEQGKFSTQRRNGVLKKIFDEATR